MSGLQLRLTFAIDMQRNVDICEIHPNRLDKIKSRYQGKFVTSKQSLLRASAR
jgi:hypothetical protein